MDTMKRLYWAIPFAYREAGEREPFDRIDAQNKEILAGLDDPTYLRSSKMDPTMNSAETYIHKADEIIAMYRQGEFPRELAKASVESTKALLARLEKEYSPSIVKPLTQAFNSHFQLWYNEVLKIVPESRFVKELFDSEHKLIDKIEAFNVAMTSEDVKKREKTAHAVGHSTPISRDRASDGDLTQDDVAADFGVTRQTVANWERGKKKNPWGYYKELRLNSDLRGAYNLLAGSAKAYNRAKAEARRRGVRFRTSFVAFNELYLKHSNSIECG